MSLAKSPAAEAAESSEGRAWLGRNPEKLRALSKVQSDWRQHMAYKIMGHGKKKIEFACPSCSSPLESPLEDAGQHFACPECQHDLTVPGIKELNYQISEAKAKEAVRIQEAKDM